MELYQKDLTEAGWRNHWLARIAEALERLTDYFMQEENLECDDLEEGAREARRERARKEKAQKNN